MAKSRFIQVHLFDLKEINNTIPPLPTIEHLWNQRIKPSCSPHPKLPEKAVPTSPKERY
tara:strand:+ start:943 stop:1119 length:177 start_codon:yes stop_codon:yes gene_type:complete